MVLIVRKINPYESCGQLYVSNTKAQPKQKKQEKEKNYDLVINVNPNRQSSRGRSKTETTDTTTQSENTLTFSSMALSRRKRHEQGLDRHVFQNIPYPFPNPQEKQKKQSKNGFISSFLKGSRSKSTDGEMEIMAIKRDNHFQSMIGILAQLRAVCKVTMEISAELTTEVNRIGNKIVSINHRLEAARRKTLFHTSVKTKTNNTEPSSSESRIHRLATKEHERAKQNTLGRYPDPPLPNASSTQRSIIGIPEALKHRYDKRCHKDPQFHSSSDAQLMTITSIIFKDYKEIPSNGPFCSFMHDVEVLNWVKAGHMTKCSELYSFPKLFQLKWNERCASLIRSGSSIDETYDESEIIPETSKERPAQILLSKKGKDVPKFVTNYLNGEVDEDKHYSVNFSESVQFFKELSFESSSTRTSNSSCSNGTIICNSQKYVSLIELIETQIHRHVDNSMDWQVDNEKKKPRNKRDSLLYINEEYYAKKRCRDKLKESIRNYQKTKKLLEEIKMMESDNDDEGSLNSDTGSVIRISKASFSDRPRPSSIDTVASAINIEFDDSPPNIISKNARLSTIPYYNYLVNSKHGNRKSDDDSGEYSDEEAQTETLSNLPSIFNIIEASRKNVKHMAPPVLPATNQRPNNDNNRTNNQIHFENNRRRAVIDMDGEELTILHTLRSEKEPHPINHRLTEEEEEEEEEDQTMNMSEVAFSFGPITTLTQEVISIDKISERVQKSKPLIQSHLHNTGTNRNINNSNISKKRNIDNNHPVLGKLTQQPKIVHPHQKVQAQEEEETEEEYSSTEEEESDTDTMSDFPRCERVQQEPSSFISDATLMEASPPPPVVRVESTAPPVTLIPRKVDQQDIPKIIEPNKSLFKEEVAQFRSFRPSTSSYSSALSFDEGFLDSVVPITQVSTTNPKPKSNKQNTTNRISHLSPSIDFDLPSSYEYSLKIMELEQKKHVPHSHFYQDGSSFGDDDENYPYSEDEEYDDGMYHIPESHQSRYIPSDSSFSDMDSF